MKTKPAAVEKPTTPDGWSALVRQRIEESGLSARRFAEEVLTRDERTVRRWVSGESPIPERVQDFLVAPWRAPWP